MPRKKRSRARKGSGSIRPYGRQFRAEWRYTPPGGQQVRRSMILDTRAEAEEWIGRQRLKGKPGAGTLADYLERWSLLQEQSVERGDLAAVTWKRYRQLLAKHVTTAYGSTQLRDVDAPHTRRWLSSLERSRVPAGERKRVAVVLRIALNAAVKAGELAASPFPAVAIPRADSAESRALTEEEARRLIATAAELGHGVLFRVWLDIGTRFTELAALKWEDYDRAAGVLHVKQAMDLASKKLKRTKTEKSRRAIPLSPEARTALESLPAGDPDSPIFPSPTGLHRRYRNFLRDVFYPVREAAGLTWVTTRTQRHTMATLLLADTDARIVSRRLGHKSVRTTEDIYSHVHTAGAEQAATSIGRRLGGLPEVSSADKIPEPGTGEGGRK